MTDTCKPFCRFSRRANALDVYVGHERETSEVINDQLWLYRGLDSGEIVGCRVMGVAALIDGLRASYGEARADDVIYPWCSRLRDNDNTELSTLDAMCELWCLCSDQPLVIEDEPDEPTD